MDYFLAILIIVVIPLIPCALWAREEIKKIPLPLLVIMFVIYLGFLYVGLILAKRCGPVVSPMF